MARALRVTARVLAVVVTVLLVLVLLAAGGLGWAARRSFPVLDGTLRLPGLAAPVSVVRDAQGVPDLTASSVADLFAAQGYVDSQDRFWEMDFRRHLTAGRLSEWFGSTTLDTDKAIRTMGWRAVAEQEYDLLTPASRAVLQAYARGVNAWLAGHRGLAASLEYGVLALQVRGYSPEPWTPVDSLAWLKAMAWDLSTNMSDEIDRSVAAATLPVSMVDQLYPPYPATSPYVLSEGGVVGGVFDPAATAPPRAAAAAAAVAPSPAVLAALDRVSGVERAVQAVLGPRGDGIGSNNWVVSGTRTASGKPLLANDPHLAPSMPSIWHQVGLHCAPLGAACPVDESGFGFSGLPGVVIGHNARIAWGFTDMEPDCQDLYVEQVDGDRYRTPAGWQPMTVHTETIKVAGGPDVTLRVRATRHGPLVSDAMSGAADAAKSAPLPVRPAGGTFGAALRWTALEPHDTFDALTAMATAGTWPQFRAALAAFAVPAQNVVYADVDGHIGYQAPGLVPIRPAGDTGTWPVAGWTDAGEWQGYVPFDALPYTEDPAGGAVVSANNQVGPPGYPYPFGPDTNPGLRAARITALLGDRTRLSATDMSAVQMDTRSPLLPAIVPALLAVGGLPEQVARARDLLRGWDGSQPVDSAAAAFANAAWRHVVLRMFVSRLPEDHRPDGGARTVVAVTDLLATPDSPWWDDPATPQVEHRDDLLRAAMADAQRELAGSQGGDPAGWRWGRMHTLTIQNQTFGTSGIALLERLFNTGPFRMSGSRDAVFATGSTADQGYTVDWVPSMHMVVDLSDLDASRWVDLTGVSGHAGNAYYGNQTATWASGGSYPWPFTAAAVTAAARHRLTLTP